MQVFRDHHCHPELRELVIEASLALARLDADRLEALALSCQALNRDLAFPGNQTSDLDRQARDAQSEMAGFGRVLDATRGNLEGMSRPRERGRGQREYAARLPTGSAGAGGAGGEVAWEQ